MTIAFGLAFGGVIVKLVTDWAFDDNYSHGFFIVPLAVYFAWERRSQLAAAAWRPSYIGLLVVVTSLAVLVAGTLGAELFLTRIAIVGTLTGAVLYVLGREHVRILAFPLVFLLLMIPIPAIIFNQIALPLQLVASQMGEQTLSALQVPVLREGNIIVLPHAILEVAEACSGIRSLVSLLTLGIVYAYFAESRAMFRVVLAVATIPIAIVANGLRVAGTGVAAHHFGAGAADGFLHTFSGWLVFTVSAVMLGMIHVSMTRAATFRDRA